MSSTQQGSAYFDRLSRFGGAVPTERSEENEYLDRLSRFGGSTQIRPTVSEELEEATQRSSQRLREVIQEREARLAQRKGTITEMLGNEEGTWQDHAANLAAVGVNMAQKMATGAATTLPDMYAQRQVTGIPTDVLKAYGRIVNNVEPQEGDKELLAGKADRPANMSSPDAQDTTFTESGYAPGRQMTEGPVTTPQYTGDTVEEDTLSYKDRLNRAAIAVFGSEVISSVTNTDSLVDWQRQERLKKSSDENVAPYVDDAMESFASLLDSGDEALRAETVKEAWNKISDPETKEQILDLSLETSGALFSAMSEAIKDPAASGELAAQMVPQVMLAMRNKALMLGTEGGMALDMLRASVVKDIQEGNMPTQEELVKRTVGAYSHAGLSALGTTAVGSSIKNAPVKSGTEKTKGAVLRNVRNSVGATGVETATEAAQGGLENIIEGEEVSSENIAFGAVSGFAGSAPLTGGATVGSTLSGLSEERRNRITNAYKADNAAKEETTAEDTQDAPPMPGNAEVFKGIDEASNPASESYNPTSAVTELGKIFNSEEVAPEDREAARTRTTAVIDKEQEQLDELVRKNDRMKPNIANAIKGIALPKLEAELEGLAKGSTEHTDVLRRIRNQKDRIAAIEALTDKDRAEMDKAATQQRELVRQLRSAEAELFTDTEIDSTPENVQAMAEQVSQPGTDTESQARSREAAENITRLAMRSQENVDAELIQGLVNDTNNALTDSQRNLLSRFSDSQIARNRFEKGKEGVHNDILHGNKKTGDMGIVDHQRAMSSAMKSGNQAQINKTKERFAKFASGHQAKVEALKGALSKAEQSGEQVNIVRDENDNWVETDLTGKALSREGGYYVQDNVASRKLINDVQAESELLNKSYAAAEAGASYVTSTVQDTPSSSVNTETTETTTAPKQTTASVPTQMTNQMRSDLSGLGYSSAQIKQFKPQEAWDTINNGQRAQPETSETTDGNAQAVEQLNAATQDSELAEVVERLTDHPDTEVATQAKASMYEYSRDGEFADPTAVSSTLASSLSESATDIAVLQQSNNAEVGTSNESDPGRTESVDQNTDASTQPENTETDATANEPTDSSGTTETTTSSEANPEQEADTSTTAEEAGQQRNNGRLEKTQQPAKGEQGVTNFRQPLPKDKKNQQILVGLRNVATKAFNGEIKWSDFLALDHPITDKQNDAVESFWQLVSELNEAVAGVLSEPNAQKEAYGYRDPLIQLRNSDGTWDENILSAMSGAALNWLKEGGKETVWNTEGDIAKLMGLPEDVGVPPQLSELFSQAGVVGDVLINELGAQAVKALGIKATKDAGRDEQSRLETSVGQRIYSMMVKEGLIEETTIKKSEVEAIVPGLMRNDQMTLARMAYDYDNKKSTPYVENWLESVKDTGDIITRMLTAEDQMNYPSFVPRKFTQKSLKNRLTGIPSNLVRFMQEHFKKPYELRQDGMGTLLEVLGKEQLIEIADGKPRAYWTTPDRQKSNESKRAGIERDLDNLYSFRNLMRDAFGNLSQRFYLGHDVWTNQRVGMTGHVNMQASKITRWFVGMEGWESTVDISGNVALDQNEGLQQFFLAVADSFGIKTDGMSQDAAMAEMNQKLSNPTIKAGIAALRRVEAGEDIRRDADATQAIVEASKEGGEAFHTTAGMVAYAQYLNAIESEGATDFTHKLVREVDGKTNGPMLTLWLMGAASTVEGLLENAKRGGFFSKDSPVKSVPEWASDSANRDLYQAMMATIQDKIEVMQTARKEKGKKPLNMAPIFAVTGPLMLGEKVLKAGRNLTKTPTTGINYGSGIETAVNAMAADFVDSFYDNIEKIANATTNKDGSVKTPQQKRQEIQAFLDEVNKIMWKDDKGRDSKITLDEVRKTGVPTRKLDAMQKAFKIHMSGAIKAAIKQEYGAFKGISNTVNMINRMSFGLSEANFTDYRDAALEGKPRSGAGTLKNDLTLREYDQLRKELNIAAPILHSALSKQANEIQNGLYLAKSKTGQSDQSTYTVEGDHPAGFGKRGGLSYVSQANEQRLVEPGVSGIALPVQSSDSAVNATTYGEAPYPVHNQHDATFVSPEHSKDVAKRMNKTTLDTVLNYHIPTETVATLERVMRGLLNLSNEENGKPVGTNLAKQYKEFLDDIESTLTGDDSDLQAELRDKLASENKGLLEYFTEKVEKNANDSRKLVLKALSELEAIDQYTMDGGQYFLTDADYTRIQEAMDALNDVQSTLPAVARQLSERIEASDAYTELDAQSDQEISDWMDGMEGDVDVSTETVLSEAALAPTNRARVMNALERVVATSEGDVKSVAESALARLQNSEGSVTRALDSALDEANATEVAQQINTIMERAQQDNPWGDVGSPVEAADSGWQTFFNRYGKVSGKQLARAISKKVSGEDTQLGKFSKELLAQLEKVLPDDLNVVYVTPESSTDGVRMDGVTGFKGWYEPNDASGKTIYIKSPDFTTSNLQTETLIHELLHGGLASVIANPKTKQQRDAVAGLEALRKTLEANLTGEERQSLVFKEATKNLQEFVAYSLSNAKVQKKLKRIDMGEQVDTSDTTGFGAFIKQAVRVLFYGLKGTKETRWQMAMAHTVAHTANLFADMQANKEKQVANQERLAMQADASGMTNIKNMSVTELFDALETGSTDADTNVRVRGLMTSIVNNVHGAFGTGIRETENALGLNPQDFWQRAKTEGVTPFASNTLAMNYGMNAQQEFVVEQIEASMDAAFNFFSPAYREAAKLYAKARQEMSEKDFFDGDWSQATPNEKDLARERYEALFVMRGGKSRHLSQFMAMGLVHEGMNKRLSQIQMKNTAIDTTNLASLLRSLFERSMEVVRDLVLKTNGEMAGNERLQKLANHLATTHAKRKSKEIVKRNGMLKKVEQSVKTGVETTVNGAFNIANSTVLREKEGQSTWRSGVSSALGTVVRGEVSDKANTTLNTIDMATNKRRGLIGSVIDEMLGTELTGKTGAQRLLVAAKTIETERQNIAGDTRKQVRSMFANKGKDLTEEQSAALTQVLIRNDITALVDTFSISELTDMMAPNNGRLKAEIDVLERQILGRTKFGKSHIGQARSLAYFMATEVDKSPMMVNNAGLVARLWGTEFKDQMEETTAKELEPVIDKYISLMAIEYTDTKKRKAAAEAMKHERARTDGNGVEYVLGLLRSNKRRSKEVLFGNDPQRMVKGYSKDILNPYKTIKVVTETEGQELEAMGYAKGNKIWKDPSDPGKGEDHYIYSIEDGGLSHFTSGATSLTQGSVRGTGLETRELKRGNQTKVVTAYEQAQDMTRDKLALATQLFEHPKGLFDPRMSKDRFRMPKFDNEGKARDYMHIMDSNTRDNLMERTNDVASVMGNMEASLFDKGETPKHNRGVVQALKEIYDEEYKLGPRRFIEVSPTSDDPKMREAYAMMPKNMRDAIQQEWGKKGMQVRIDMVPMMFGHRRMSLADSFKKDAVERNFMEKMLINVMTGIYGKEAETKLRNTGDKWSAVVSMVRDNVVVKNLWTLMVNIKSNFTQLFLNGMNPVTATKYMWEGYASGMAHRRDSHELFKLRQQIDAEYNPSEFPEIQQRIAELEDSLARNPARLLVEEGLMPNIVEDVNMVEDPFSYKKKYEKEFQAKFEHVPNVMKTAAKQLYMTHDTGMYRFMSQMAQMSDFTARYALYKHLTQDADQTVSHRQAVSTALNQFIHYDQPTHPKLEWANNVGLTLFTRYYLRIQKMIADSVAGNPARAITTYAMGEFLGEETILDSFGTGGFGLRGGAFEMLGAWDEPITMQAAKGLLLD